MKRFFIDQPIYEKKDYYTPFALTDILTEYSGEQEISLLHFWQLDQAMILGMKDTRVTDFPAGIRALQAAGYTPVIRNSGGLGVVSDQTVLNVSLFLPNAANQAVSVTEGYEKLTALIRKSLPELVIKTGEITDSYCPGTYDLSVSGKKIAGIAQRRVKQGIAIMLYLSVAGDQLARGAAVRRFYQESLQEAFGTQGYPPVEPASMTTLAELLPEMSIALMKKRLLDAYFNTESPTAFPAATLAELTATPAFAKRLSGMQERNHELEEDFL